MELLTDKERILDLENEVEKTGTTVSEIIKREHFDIAIKKVLIGNKTEGEREAAHQLNRRTEFRVLRTDYVPQAVRDSLADAALKGQVVDIVSGNRICLREP